MANQSRKKESRPCESACLSMLVLRRIRRRSLYPQGFWRRIWGILAILRGAPQLLQNLPEPAGFPHTGTNCLPLRYFASVDLSGFGFLFDVCNHFFGSGCGYFSAFSRSIIMHNPSCSFQSFSQTYLWHLGHLWKWPLASFCASSNACSCSLCHSGVMP